jgi:tRNA(adenine34) deaminase
MGLALQQARLAFAAGEVPIGAVLVLNSQVAAAACNSTEARRNPLSHAELLCISAAAEQQLAWRLHEATLYSTIEPCPMCAGAILQARLARLVYGAKQPRIGADGSWVAMFPKQPIQQQHAQHAQPEPCSCQPQSEQEQLQQQQAVQPVGPHPFHPNIQVTGGVLADECAALMWEFFRKRRKEQQQAAAAAAAAAAEQGSVGCVPGAVATRSAELDAGVWLGSSSSSCDSQEEQEEPSTQRREQDGNYTP